MLRRQQAEAIIDARARIVEGAVTMVQMALDHLRDSQVIEMNENQKAAMVSNLMVVLCSESETNPVINAGHSGAETKGRLLMRVNGTPLRLLPSRNFLGFGKNSGQGENT